MQVNGTAYVSYWKVICAILKSNNEYVITTFIIV
jgi:hypothetical protein